MDNKILITIGWVNSKIKLEKIKEDCPASCPKIVPRFTITGHEFSMSVFSSYCIEHRKNDIINKEWNWDK